jgi:hypothetical protein
MARNLDTPRSPNRWSPVIWGFAACLLLLPLIAMQFPGTGVDWTLSDFVVMGILLSTACGAYELATRMNRNTMYRLAAAVAVVTGFLTVWVNLAVGMILSENNLENLVFLGVLAIAIVGALIARFRARGMAIAMTAAAVAQFACAVWGAMIDRVYVGILIAVFAAFWLASAALFRVAASQLERTGEPT